MKKGKYITPNRRRQSGFTIMELVITITLVSITAALAVPAMGVYAANSRLTSSSQELLRSLQTARTEATKRQRIVVVCASANPTDDADDVACATSDIAGWIMFEDTDDSGDHEAGEEIMDIHTIDTTKISLQGDGTVTYMATGFAAPGSATAMVMCDDRGNVDSDGGTSGNSVARGIDITGTGRARITRSISEIDDLLDDIDTTCP